MKVPRAMIGRRATVTWVDPCNFEEEGDHQLNTTKSRGDLPRWEHEGIIESSADGLLRVRYAHCTNATPKKEGILIAEDLIETIKVWREDAEGDPNKV